MKRQVSWLRIILFSMLLALTCGCATLQDPEASQEFRSHEIATVTPTDRFTQTFVSRRPGLNQVLLWLRVPESNQLAEGKITISLYMDPGCRQALWHQDYRRESIKKSFPLKNEFEAVHSSGYQVFCVEIKTTSGAVIVLGRNENQYAYGEALLNEKPLAVDASFRTGYLYDVPALTADILVFLKNILVFIPLLLTIWLPGRFLLFAIRMDREFDWGGRTAISIALSLSIIPILLVWTSMLGLKWNGILVWGSMLIVSGLYAIFAVIRFRHTGESLRSVDWRLVTTNLPLLGIFILTLGARLVMVRDLAAPAWVDSVHHALISQMIIETGKLPDTFQPFFGSQTTNYHAGFHTTVAAFEWLSGMDLEKGLLLYGQVLNAAVVFGVYALAIFLTRNRIAGMVSALVCGVFSPMPAYYTSWGRYTQLSGLLILPVAFVFLIFFFHNLKEKRGESSVKYWTSGLVIGGILWGGLFLIHYRVSVFLFLLVLSYLLIEFINHIFLKQFSSELPMLTLFISGTILCGILLTLPWWPDTFKTLFLPGLSWTGGSNSALFRGFSWTFLTSAHGTYILILSGLGFVWAVFRRRNFQWVLLLWVGMMFTLANLYVWELPGSGFMNNTSVTITLFIPISILCGYVIGWMVRGWFNIIPVPRKTAFSAGICLVFGMFGIWGANSTLSLVNPITILSRDADLLAIDWVQDNIPPGQRILVNPFSWGYGVYAGADGGYWLSPLAGIPTQPPAVLYGLDSGRSINYSELSKQVIQNSQNPEELHKLISKNHIGYIFIGAKGGVLSPKLLASSPLFRHIYHEGNVWVFQLASP